MFVCVCVCVCLSVCVFVCVECVCVCLCVECVCAFVCVLFFTTCFITPCNKYMLGKIIVYIIYFYSTLILIPWLFV
jgi:hypothetical protein